MRWRPPKIGSEWCVVLLALIVIEGLILRVGWPQLLGLLEYLHLWH